MGEEPVRGDGLVCLREQRRARETPTSPGDARRGVHDDAGGFSHAGGEQRSQRERGGGRVAAGRGDRSLGSDAVTEQLGQTEHELREQLGSLVGYAVPALVVGGGEPEVAAEVDEVRDAAGEVGHQALGFTVGQGEEDQVEAVEGRRVERIQGEARVGGGQRRVQLGDRDPGVGSRRCRDDVQVGVAGEEPQQLGAGVPGGPHHAGPIRHVAYHTR